MIEERQTKEIVAEMMVNKEGLIQRVFNRQDKQVYYLVGVEPLCLTPEQWDFIKDADVLAATITIQR